jgi:hypothetical protein
MNLQNMKNEISKSSQDYERWFYQYKNKFHQLKNQFKTKNEFSRMSYNIGHKLEEIAEIVTENDKLLSRFQTDEKTVVKNEKQYVIFRSQFA